MHYENDMHMQNLLNINSQELLNYNSSYVDYAQHCTYEF